MELVSRKFSHGLDDFPIEMPVIYMKWYILTAFLTIIFLSCLLYACCRYAWRLRQWDLAHFRKIGALKEEIEVFDKRFLSRFREQARQRYLKFLEEKKQQERDQKEREKHMAEVQDIRNSFRRARAQTFKRRTNLTIAPEDVGKQEPTTD